MARPRICFILGFISIVLLLIIIIVHVILSCESTSEIKSLFIKFWWEVLLGLCALVLHLTSLGNGKTYILNIKKMQHDHLAAMRAEWETQHPRYAEVCTQINELKEQREELRAERKRIQ